MIINGYPETLRKKKSFIFQESKSKVGEKTTYFDENYRLVHIFLNLESIYFLNFLCTGSPLHLGKNLDSENKS